MKIPKPLTKNEKSIADMRMGMTSMRLAAKVGGMFNPIDWFKRPEHYKQILRSQSAFNRMMKQKKYSRFDGKIFFDLYTPGFPSKGFNRLVGEALGQDGWQDHNKPKFIANVDLAVTGKCMFRCEHCYASEALVKKDVVSLEEWRHIIDRFQESGVGVFSFVGGEPLLRFDDMCELITHASKESDCWIVTTGMGLTHNKAKRLKEAGLVGASVSLDHYEPEKHNEFRGNKKAYDGAIQALALFAQVGVYPALAICATREMLQNNGLLRYLELALEMGAGSVQVMEPIRSGMYVGDEDVALTQDELRELQRQQQEFNTAPKYAHLPAVTTRTSLEDGDIGGGCGAGGNSFIYVDPAANLQPCPVMNVSSGNLVQDGFDVAMGRMRELFPRQAAIGAECPANTLANRIAEAHRQTQQSPVPYEATKDIVSDFSLAPLAPIMGGEQLSAPWKPSGEVLKKVGGDDDKLIQAVNIEPANNEQSLAAESTQQKNKEAVVDVE